MKKTIFFLLLGCSIYALAQNSQAIQKEIDQTVWKPFQQAFETIDGEALNSLYAAEVLRVTPSGIDTQNEFKSTNLKRFTQNKANGDSIKLDWWWDDRKTSEDTSYEVGFYRIKFTTGDGATNTVYGQFHIVLKKIAGHWKITQDWDTTTIAGQKIDSTLFATKKPLQF
jgi:ketosteroid isomerase-like protein